MSHGLLPVLAVASLVLCGCTGSLARAIVEPDAGGLGPDAATVLPEEQLLALRSAVTGKLRADTLKAEGADGAVIHAVVLEPGPYGLEWIGRRDADGDFRFSFGFEPDTAALRRQSDPRGTVVALHGLGAEGVQLLVHGRQDDLVPMEQAERLHRALPCSTLRPVDDRGHVTLTMDRTAAAELVLIWLAGSRACAPDG